MKNTIILTIILLLVCSLVACNSPLSTTSNESTETSITGNTDTESSVTENVESSTTDKTANQKVKEYVEQYKSTILSSFESSFATSSGMTCKSDIKVEGAGFIITIKIDQLSNVDSATKKALQDAYDAQNSTFASSLKTFQTAIPELEYYEVIVCDKDGDVLATIHADGTDTESSVPEDVETSTSDETANQKVKEYVEKSKEIILSSFESSFATSSGMTCKSDIKVEGAGFIITIKIDQLSNVDSATKKSLQDAYDAQSASFESSLKTFQTAIPELEYYEVIVCDKTGDVLATIHAGK